MWVLALPFAWVTAPDHQGRSGRPQRGPGFGIGPDQQRYPFEAQEPTHEQQHRQWGSAERINKTALQVASCVANRAVLGATRGFTTDC